MKISVICVFNNSKMMSEQLMSSLELQDVQYEFVGVDNSQKIFSSAASALNDCAQRANGDILVFSHQDIRLKTKDALRRFAEAVSKTEVGDVVGTQGVRERSKIYYSNLTAGDTFIAEELFDYKDELISVACVDEGFFGMKKETWENHPFDEVLCDNWHLYTVESCLYARKMKHAVYVCPIQLHHFSYGRISISYMNNLKLLCKIYKKDFKYIWTTCYKVRTNSLYINLLVFAWKTNRIIRKKGLE